MITTGPATLTHSCYRVRVADTPTDETPGEQLERELSQRLAPFDLLATAAGKPGSALQERLGDVGPIVDDLDSGRARAIVGALWPTDDPPAWWWQTPLGRTVAGPLADATPESEVVKVAEAARMLGHGHTRVYQLADSGFLDRAEGGVTLRSVLRRVANPGRPGTPGWRPEAERS